MDYTFTQIDINFLHKVYSMRCLTLQQGYDYFYKNQLTFNEYIKTKIVPMQLNKIIKLMPFIGNYAIMLDRNGHDYLRDNILVKEIIDVDRNKIKKGYNNLGENNILPRTMNHQCHLNEFVLECELNIEKLTLLKDIDLDYTYSDEKQVSKYLFIRPDGLLSITNNVSNDTFDFFLEMDMSTENSKQLKHKFIRYNNFVKSREFYARHEKILVLFIVANSEKINERKRLIRKLFNDYFNMYNSRFELFIGSKNECMNVLFSSVLNKRDALKYLKEARDYGIIKNIVKTSSLKLEELNLPEYIIRLETGKTFFYDSFIYKPNSVLSKITYYHRINSDYKLKINNNKDTDYLIVTEDPLETLKDLDALQITGTKNIYFTTPERLKTMPFHEAIYMYGYDGSVSSFTDNTFGHLKYEKNIKDN